MKKHSLYLREDQTAFLKSLSNASGFMRECLDVAISSERGSTEKTICLYEGAKELEAKITAQALLTETNGEEAEEIEKKIKKAQSFLKVAQRIANGEFEIEPYQGKFRVLAELEEDRYTVVTKGHDTEEEAKARAIEKGKIGIENMKCELKELAKKKQRHEQYVEAQKVKLKNMEENLQKLYSSMNKRK